MAEAAFAIAEEILKPGGIFVAKVFQGGAEGELLAQLKRSFAELRHAKPPASRAESPETYVVARGFRGAGSRLATPSGEESDQRVRLRGCSDVPERPLVLRVSVAPRR